MHGLSGGRLCGMVRQPVEIPGHTRNESFEARLLAATLGVSFFVFFSGENGRIQILHEPVALRAARDCV